MDVNDQTIFQLAQDIGSVKEDTQLLRRELLGNGRPGRMELAEKAIKELQDARTFQHGMLYSISLGASVLFTAVLRYTKEIWHFFSAVLASKR